MALFGEDRSLRQRLAERLGHAEVDHLRHGLSVADRDEDVAGFDVAVDDAFLMGVLHGLADLHEQVQALRDAQLVPVAVFGDGHAGHVLHGEVGPTQLTRARLEDHGHVGVVHEGQRLPLGLEAGNYRLGVHARRDDLEGHAAAHRFLLLGQVDDAETAFTKPAEDSIWTDALGDGLGGARAGEPRRTAFQRRIVRR